MDEEDVLVQQLVKSLAFEVEAVAAENLVKFSTNGTPLNVKVRVRNKDEPRLVQRGLVTVPRIANQLTTPERIRLISSDQTILSFNVYMETELEKETQTPKNRKHGFNFLKFGGCLGTSVGEDNDEGAYIPETSNKSQSGFIIDEIEESQEKVKLNMENSKIIARNQKGFFGKCKPGGCLDPPFSEDKYPYSLPKTQQLTKPNLALNKAEESKDNRSNSISNVEPRKLSKLKGEPAKKGQRPSRSEVELKPLVDIFARTSSSQNSIGSNHSNIITYPPRLSSSEMIRDNQDTRKRQKSKTFNESPRQTNDENPLAYFVPPKDSLRHKEEERRYSRELSSDQIRINDDCVKDGTNQNNDNRKKSLRNHSFDISSINNAEVKSSIKPIAISVSQGREENYPKRVRQTSTDLTLNDIDNVRKIPLQGRKKSDILLLTPHENQIENVNKTKFAEIIPNAVSASQGREENYPKRDKHILTDLSSNDKDNLQIIPPHEKEISDVLLLTPHVNQIENVNNTKFAEIKPIAVSASQGREENYPKRVKQIPTDLTSNDNDNVLIKLLQGEEKSDILLTPHENQIENVNKTKFAEIIPNAVSASQGREENYPKRDKQILTDLSSNDKDKLQIIPPHEKEKSDVLLLTPHVNQIENVNNTKFSEIKPIAVSASQGREENYPKRVKQTPTDLISNDNVNVRIKPLQGGEKSDELLSRPDVDQIKNIDNRPNIVIQSDPVTGLNNLGDFDNRDDVRFQTKSQLNTQGTSEYDFISSDHMIKKFEDKKDNLYDTKDQTNKDKSMPSAKALDSEKGQKLKQREIPTEPLSQNKKSKLTLSTNPNFISSLQNLLDTSDLKAINNGVFDTSSQDTQIKAKNDTNTYPSTSADADKIRTSPQKPEITKSQTQTNNYMNENQNKDLVVLSNGADVSKTIDHEQPFKQEFFSSDADPIKNRSDDKRAQEANQDNKIKESTPTKTLQATHKSDTVDKFIENRDIFNKQTYVTPILEREINNEIDQDQNNQLNNLSTREFQNKATYGKQKEQDKERIANIYDIREDNLNNTDGYMDSIKRNAHPDNQNIMNNLGMPMSQTGQNNINDAGMLESHVIQPFMTENGEQGLDNHMSQTQLITDTRTKKRQANKKLQNSDSHDSKVNENKEYAAYSTHSLGSHKNTTSTYYETKQPMNIQNHKDKSSGSKIVQPSSVDQVIIQNDLLFDYNEIPDTESREKRSSLVKMPFAALGSDLRNVDASKMIPLKHKSFPIVESNKSMEKQIEEISTLQNLRRGGSRTENDDKSVPQGQVREEILDGREIQLVGSDSALNLTNLVKKAEIQDSDKKATEIIGISRIGDRTTIDDADSTYFQPKYQNISTTETDGSKNIQNQLTFGLDQDFAPLSLGLPLYDTNQIHNIDFKSPEPLKPDRNIDTTENLFDNRKGMDREGDSETKKLGLIRIMHKPLTTASGHYFKELLEDINPQLVTKPHVLNNAVSESKINRLADQLSSTIITDETNREVSTLPLNYTLEDGTTIFNRTMEKTYLDPDKISSAIIHQEPSGGIGANNAIEYNPQLSTTVVGKMDSEFNAANINNTDTETLNFKPFRNTYDDLTKITSAPLKSTTGDYNLEKTVPQSDEFTDDSIIKRLGLGVKKDTNNKKSNKQKDPANFMKQSDPRKTRGSKKSIDETRRIFKGFTKLSNNKSIPISRILDTHPMNQTNPEILDISVKPAEKDKFELLLNMKFQTYVNENNDIVVQTLNPHTEEQDLKSDKVTVVSSIIRPGNEVKIQVDSEHNLTLSLFDNYHRERDGHQKYDELKAFQDMGPGATENEFVLHKNLTLLYESELVPLHNAIMDLTEEINSLSANQQLLKAKLRVQGVKRTRSTRLTPVSKHCGCRRS